MKRKTKVYIYNAIVIALLIGGIAWVTLRFAHLGDVEFTDNAYVHRQVTPVNADGARPPQPPQSHPFAGHCSACRQAEDFERVTCEPGGGAERCNVVMTSQLL